MQRVQWAHGTGQEPTMAVEEEVVGVEGVQGPRDPQPCFHFHFHLHPHHLDGATDCDWPEQRLADC